MAGRVPVRLQPLLPPASPFIMVPPLTFVHRSACQKAGRALDAQKAYLRERAPAMIGLIRVAGVAYIRVCFSGALFFSSR